MIARPAWSSRLSNHFWQKPFGPGWRMMSPKGPEPLREEDHMSHVQPLSSPKRAYVPPPVDGDFYQIKDLLAKEERAILARVRASVGWFLVRVRTRMKATISATFVAGGIALVLVACGSPNKPSVSLSS